MARRDAYHDVVKSALEKDGWVITHDPLYIAVKGVEAYIDLGAERQSIAAEKDGKKIAVEIKILWGLLTSMSFKRLSVNILCTL